MKEFRFTWNGRVMSKADTRTILFTIFFALLGVLGTILGLLTATGE